MADVKESACSLFFCSGLPSIAPSSPKENAELLASPRRSKAVLGVADVEGSEPLAEVDAVTDVDTVAADVETATVAEETAVVVVKTAETAEEISLWLSAVVIVFAGPTALFDRLWAALLLSGASRKGAAPDPANACMPASPDREVEVPAVEVVDDVVVVEAEAVVLGGVENMALARED